MPIVLYDAFLHHFITYAYVQ